MPEAPLRSGRYAWIERALDGERRVLTGSRRLARELRRAFNERQIATGKAAWPSPQIYFWRDWLDDLQASNGTGRARIGGTTSAILWERAMGRQLDRDLPGASSLNRQLSSTWLRLSEWRVDIETLTSAAQSTDERAFAQAANDYLAELATQGWVDDAQASELAIGSLPASELPAGITLAGFDRMNPQVLALRSALESCGTAIELIDPGDPPVTVPIQTYSDEESEFRAAGRWARSVLEAEPTARVAVVSADLDSRATRQTRLLREGLVPGWQQGGLHYVRAVNVSYGRRLADYPLISAALTCLRWSSTGLSSRDVSLLLRCSFVGGEEASARARLDRQLRRLPDRTWSAAAFADALEDASERLNATDWQRAVRQIAAVQGAGSILPSACAARIDQLLQAIGWPGAEALDSEEYQLVERWRRLLDELASLDTVSPRLSLHDAIQRISSLARETIYQPERGDGLVQLLGPLEAAGMEFDFLWLAGMDATRWPRPGGPLPFVAQRLQRQCGMPDATPADSLEYSNRVIRRLLGSAPVVRMSWARLELDAEQIATPALAELPGVDIIETEDADDPGWYAAGQMGQAHPRPVPDDRVPTVDGIEAVAGGARVVAWQQSEPFVAFARGRLAVRELDRFQAGLPASLRGDLLHESLSNLYQDRPGQQQIVAWSEVERAARIDRAVRSALAPAERSADSVLRRLLAIEGARLRLLVDEFLTREALREPFRVERVEERMVFRHAGIELSLRADRVDRLADDSLLIIDYKTGQTRNLLNRDRDPVDPQVVVYAAATDDAIGGLALFNVNRREIRISSAGRNGEWGKFDEEEWAAAVTRWKAQVFTAIESIAMGDVRVNPLLEDDYSWQLNVLSRIGELRRGG